MWKSKKYIVPCSNHEILITADVIKTFINYLQIKNKPESGGLLFAEINLPLIIVKKATKPNETDLRSLYLFKPDQIKQQEIINKLFRKKLHFVGEWHTHPEIIPSPSILDLNSMRETYIKSKHELNFFLMIIVGNKISSEMFWVGLHNKNDYLRLEEV